jgi:hypothetical protein
MKPPTMQQARHAQNKVRRQARMPNTTQAEETTPMSDDGSTRQHHQEECPPIFVPQNAGIRAFGLEEAKTQTEWQISSKA